MPDTSDMSVTRAAREQHELHQCYRKDKSVTRVLHECYTKDTTATWVKNFDFDNDKSKNLFSPPYISYMATIKRRWTTSIKNNLLETPRSHVKMRLKSAPQKLVSVMAKAISISYILDCSCKCLCTFRHSYTL